MAEPSARKTLLASFRAGLTMAATLGIMISSSSPFSVAVVLDGSTSTGNSSTRKMRSCSLLHVRGRISHACHFQLSFTADYQTTGLNTDIELIWREGAR